MRFVVAIVVLLNLTACISNREPLGRDFGNAVQNNIAVQVVNPVAPVGLAETDGTRIDNAIQRYETNHVYVPQPQSGSALDTATTTQPTAAPTPSQ